jgi:hypothetical protein
MLIIDFDKWLSPCPSAHNIFKISSNGEQKVMQLIFIFDPDNLLILRPVSLVLSWSWNQIQTALSVGYSRVNLGLMVNFRSILGPFLLLGCVCLGAAIATFTSVMGNQKTAAEAAAVALYSWELEFLQLMCCHCHV